MRRLTRGYTVALGAIMMLGACSTPPAGPDGSTGSPTASTSPSATSTSPTSAPATTSSPTSGAPLGQSADGAVEFVNFFLRQANQAFTSLNPELVFQLSSSQCKTCTSMIEQIRKYKGARQRFVGEFAHPTFVAINKFEMDSAQVLVENDSPGGRVVDEAGRTVEQLSADQGKVIVSLNYESSGWRVLGIQETS